MIVVLVIVVVDQIVVPTMLASVDALHEVALALVAESKYSSKTYKDPKARRA